MFIVSEFCRIHGRTGSLNNIYRNKWTLIPVLIGFWRIKSCRKTKSKYSVGKLKLFSLSNRMCSLFKLLLLFVEIFMDNFMIFFNFFQKGVVWPAIVTSWWGTLLIGGITQWKPLLCFFSTSLSTLIKSFSLEAITSHAISPICMGFMMKSQKSMEIKMSGITSMRHLIIYLLLPLYKVN